jgi:hypothetical protein
MSKLNPELKKDDRIVLVHMDGESLGAGIKGKVISLETVPNFTSKQATSVVAPDTAHFTAAFLDAPTTSITNIRFSVNGKPVEPAAITSFTESNGIWTLILNTDKLGFKLISKYKVVVSSDVGILYRVEWYDENNNIFSGLSLIPEDDAWIMDPDFQQENIQEINFRNLDDLIAKGDFLAVFSKKELEKVYEFLELERQIGSHNMAMEGGKFLLMGPDYIRDFFKLQSYHIKPDKEKEILIKKLINRSEDIYNLFIRASMEYLDNKKIKYSLKDVQKTMVRLATTAKQFWMSEANKFLNKEIE